MKGVIDQYSLVLITNHALNKIRGHVWRSSFETVNLRPSTHVSFNLLKETNEFKTALKAGDNFFLETHKLVRINASRVEAYDKAEKS